MNGIIRGYIIYLNETNANCSKLHEEFNVTFRRAVTSNFILSDDVTTDRVTQLKKFTFYSIEAVAYTSIGSAKRRPQCNIFRTLEDGMY